MSPGNGHPYSWSAIFNGYDPFAMSRCPFPSIPAYLAQRRFPEDAIAAGRVTHVWTQDRRLSDEIAAASLIDGVVDEPVDMIGTVDAVLLARDDAENHLRFAAPFLEAGLPIYIDKPIALSIAAAEVLYTRQKRPGQIFTCSALAYAPEFQPTMAQLAGIGKLRRVEATTVKDWDRYAVHVIEPLINLVATDGRIESMRACDEGGRRLDIVWESGLAGFVKALGTEQGSIGISLEGDNGRLDLVFADSFTAFRAALQHFVDIVLGCQPPQDSAAVFDVVRVIEAGRKGV